MRVWLLLLSLCAVLALGSKTAYAASAAAEAAVTVGTLPAWVKRIEPDFAGKAPEGATADGTYLLLSDVQRRFSEKASESYVHRARRLQTATAVESFSQIRVELRPAYERLVFHSLRIRRGAETIDVLKRDAIKVFDSETDLDAKMLHGTVTANVVLDDVRVGDVVESEFSIVGANPVFGGAIVGAFDLAYPEPVHRLHRRLLVPAARNVTHKVFGATATPEITVVDGERALDWDRRAVAALIREDMLPPGYDPSVWVEWSDFAAWTDVVAWATPMYTAGTVDAALKARIDAIVAASKDRESQLLAALKLVQTEIRYLGIELGTSSHRPEQSSVVYQRRFGDCKDKTMLLVTLLHALGFEAEPAFVNTKARAEVEGFLPSPLAFDHVIVRAKLDDRVLWLDGTNTIEGGTLDVREPPPFGRALVVSPKTAALEPIVRPRPAAPLTSVEETWVVADFQGPATLDVHTVHRRHEADDWRDRLATEPRSEIERLFLNFYAKIDPGVSQLAAPTFADDPKANVFEIREHYRIPAFWKNEERFFEPYALERVFQRPRIVLRTMPLAVPFPLKAEHRIEVRFPAAYESTPDHRVLEDATLKLESDYRSDGNVVTIRYALETKRDTVPAAEVAEYLAMLERVDDAMRWGVDQRAKPSPDAPKKKEAYHPFYGFLVVCGIWVVWVVGRGLVDRVRSARRQRRVTPRRGETPATALRVQSDAEIESEIAKARCACGARWSGMGTERVWSEAAYEGRRVSAVRTSCPSCGDWTRIWFDRREGDA